MDYKNINDYELIYMIREDDNNRNIIFNKYRPVIEKIARKYSKILTYSFIELDDLIQEGYVALDRTIDSYDDRNSLFYTFANVCINRHIANYVKSINRNKNIFNNTYSYDDDTKDCNYLELLGSDIYCPLDEVLYNSYTERIVEIKNNLNNEQSAVFELRFNGFNRKEIAILLDISESKVNGIIQKIKLILKRSGLKKLIEEKY